MKVTVVKPEPRYVRDVPDGGAFTIASTIFLKVSPSNFMGLPNNPGDMPWHRYSETFKDMEVGIEYTVEIVLTRKQRI